MNICWVHFTRAAVELRNLVFHLAVHMASSYLETGAHKLAANRLDEMGKMNEQYEIRATNSKVKRIE